ncbi:MAG TPA: right-handed parallel beta-helix repeat-containing protein, partial [Planctomycetota bacterium]|nr:right-handed parallel beta-helix repeat-containing protein [Planctomycetota bacterium]
VDQVTLSSNLAAQSGVDFTMQGCDRVDVTNTSITAAPGPGRIGLHIDQGSNVRVGLGTSVLDHGAQGVLLTHSADVTLGNWPPGAGAIAVRGPAALQIDDCDRVAVLGTASAPCTLQAGTAQSSFAVSITNARSGNCGPNVVIDGRQAVPTALQLAGSAGWTVDGAAIGGHTSWGVVASSSPQLLIRNCTVDGGAQQAANEGILLTPGCHGARLFGNLVERQLSSGFHVVDSNDVLLGPGNRAIDNAGDGFLVSDSGIGSPSRRVTIQSTVAIGRGLAAQSGVRCVHMLAALTNVTTTRHGIGVLLQLGSNATLVNTISWGNGVDRNRDGSSSGTWRHGLRATTAGSSAPGSWSEQDMIVGQSPQFVAAATGDVRLQSGSPAIDSGLHASPAGSGLPCSDAALLPRIRGGTIDRGAYEFVPAGGTGNSLDLAGPWLRPLAQNQLDFAVQRTPAQAGQWFLLLCSGSGTGPGVTAPGGAQAPLVPDAFTALLLTAPSWCLGRLDGSGHGSLSLPLPPSVLPLLPELSFAAVLSSGGQPTNPVVVRFLP